WVGRDDLTVTIQPVIDLNETLHADGYEIPHRLDQHIKLRDRTCVFPWCERPASRCDTDHIDPYRHDSDPPRGEKPDDAAPPDDPPDDVAEPQTSTENLAPLCRRHHRIKTFGRWSYLMIEPGTYLWTSPHGQHYLRDHTGTRTADPPDD
ncbi:MAG: HNH endonuclease signature motif containing protein, partial [Nocardioidaceae bacterium]